MKNHFSFFLFHSSQFFLNSVLSLHRNSKEMLLLLVGYTSGLPAADSIRFFSIGVVRHNLFSTKFYCIFLLFPIIL